jgi:hypothetical protein
MCIEWCLPFRLPSDSFVLPCRLPRARYFPPPQFIFLDLINKIGRDFTDILYDRANFSLLNLHLRRGLQVDS